MSTKLHHVFNQITWVNESKFQCIVFDKGDNLGTFNSGDCDVLPDDNVNILG